MKKNTNNKITVAFEDITPEIAKRYLARNLANRNLRESTVRAYELDMRSGNWASTHQGIAFNDRGDLIDGQHRLTAIVRSGVTVRMLVTRGIPVEQGATKTMDAVDRGAVRSIQDQLKLQHGFRNPYRDVGAANAIAFMVCGPNKNRMKTKATVSQVLQILEVYGRHIADIGSAMDASHEKRLRRSNFVGAIAFARAVDPGIVDRFLAGIIKGANLAEDSPVLAFRNFLLSDASLRWTIARQDRVQFSYVVLNSLRRFSKSESSKDVHAGNAGYVFFASKQPENIAPIAKIFLVEPQPLKPEPEQAIRETKSMDCVASRFVRSAKDIGGITPEAEALIARVDNSKRFIGTNRVDYMRKRIKSGALEA
jgi:hypothetical protein